MAEIKSGASADKLTIDPTSKAARVTLYDARGNLMGQKATYAAAVTAKTAVFAGTAPFLALYGSASKVIRVQRILVTATVATAAVYGDLVVRLRTATISGGTKTDLTQVATDQNNPAATAAICGLYTAAPTAGTGGGPIAAMSAYCPITATAALGPGFYDFDWRHRWETEAPVLRGTGQGVEVAFGTTPTNAPTVVAAIWWTEE